MNQIIIICIQWSCWITLCSTKRLYSCVTEWKVLHHGSISFAKSDFHIPPHVKLIPIGSAKRAAQLRTSGWSSN